MTRDPWTDLYHLAERLARVLDEVQPGGGTARAWLTAVRDDPRSATVRSYFELVQRLGGLILGAIPPDGEEKAGT